MEPAGTCIVVVFCFCFLILCHSKGILGVSCFRTTPAQLKANSHGKLLLCFRSGTVKKNLSVMQTLDWNRLGKMTQLSEAF